MTRRGTNAGPVGTTATTPAEPLARGAQRRVLTSLCLTEITSWGVLYYAFPVLLIDITASTGWSPVAVTAAFSVGQLVAAVTGIPVGRWLDRHGPRGIMTAGSLVAVPSVVLVAGAQNLVWFFGAWMLAGAAMGAVLYPPAFAALTRWYGPRRISALTTLTLVAGLASTVFAPVTAALADWSTWRQTYVVLAVVLAVVTVPLHAWGLRGPWPDVAVHRTSVHADPRAIARSRAFLALLVALALAVLAAFAAVVNLVPLLTERGLDTTTAAVALGLGGAGQVVGRLGYGLATRTGVRLRTVAVLMATALTTALLGVLTSATALVLAAVAAGMARGILTLVQATAVPDRWGSAHYGRLTGLLSAPLNVTAALAPWSGAALAAVFGGYAPTFLLLAGLALVASVVALASAPGPPRGPAGTTASRP